MAKGAPTAFIDFDIVGNERGVQEMLNTIDSALSPVGLAAFLFGAVGPYIKDRAKDRFEDEGDDVTGRWAPLKEATVRIRIADGFEGEHPINKRTGELEEYITQGQVGGVTGPGVGILRYPDNPPRRQAIVEKMRTAQTGRANPSTVARPVLGLNERDLSVVMTMLAFHIRNEGVTRGHVGR